MQALGWVKPGRRHLASANLKNREKNLHQEAGELSLKLEADSLDRVENQPIYTLLR